MKKYRKRPVVIEAMELKNDTYSQEEVAKWCNGKKGPDGGVFIETLEGRMYAGAGDYIIKGINGEFYPCKPNIFKATYEPVGDNPEGTGGSL